MADTAHRSERGLAEPVVSTPYEAAEAARTMRALVVELSALGEGQPGSAVPRRTAQEAAIVASTPGPWDGSGQSTEATVVSANGACMNVRVGAAFLCVGLAASACTTSPSANSRPSSPRSGHTSASSPVGPTTTPATISTLPIPSPTPACPPGCRYPSNFDAITVLASSATTVAIVTVNHPVNHGVAGSISIDSVLQGNSNGNVYPPSPYDLARVLALANAGTGRSYLVFSSFNRGGPCPSALFAYDPTTRVATFVHQWTDLGPNNQIPLPGRITTIPAIIALAALRSRLYPTGGVTYPVDTDESFCPGP